MARSGHRDVNTALDYIRDFQGGQFDGKYRLCPDTARMGGAQARLLLTGAGEVKSGVGPVLSTLRRPSHPPLQSSHPNPCPPLSGRRGHRRRQAEQSAVRGQVLLRRRDFCRGVRSLRAAGALLRCGDSWRRAHADARTRAGPRAGAATRLCSRCAQPRRRDARLRHPLPELPRHEARREHVSVGAAPCATLQQPTPRSTPPPLATPTNAKSVLRCSSVRRRR